MGKLTAIGVRAATKPGRYGDGDGLHLHVRAAGQRAWVLRYMRDGRSRDMGLGPYPEVTLAEAREKASAARKQVRAGADPVDARRRDRVARTAMSGQTFRAAAEELIADKGKGWRNPKHRAQWSSTLVAYAYPAFGDRPVREVDTDAVMAVLRPLWERVPETASRLRGRIEAVLDAARARGWREGENPARWKGNLASRLPTPRKVKATQHHPALPWQKAEAFMVALRQRKGVAARAIEMVILTAARSGEVRGMCWGEIDMAAAVWIVPASRMKAERLHRVPLSAAALAMLEARRPDHTAADALVFPGAAARKQLSDMSLTATLRRMNEVALGQAVPWTDPVQGKAITVHGFRSTFRVWAGEAAQHPREVVEAALAHTLKDKAEAAYARTDLLERRRPLMEAWARHVAGDPPS